MINQSAFLEALRYSNPGIHQRCKDYHPTNALYVANKRKDQWTSWQGGAFAGAAIELASGRPLRETVNHLSKATPAVLAYVLEDKHTLRRRESADPAAVPLLGFADVGGDGRIQAIYVQELPFTVDNC